MKCFFITLVLTVTITITHQEEVRLLDLDPQDAQQIIEQQDTSLKYAPKVESNVPAVRYLGNEPHNVVEDIYLANQYHGQDGLGGYLYGYSVPDITKTEKKKAGGDLRGAYNYIAGNGQEIKVEYWDDGTGFHQVDNVPKNLPEDLPEVKRAKEEFMRIWQEQAERNSHPVQDPYNSEGQYKEGPLSVQGQLHRQQQFDSQFGKGPGLQQSGYQPAASQQKPIYQSNLETTAQTYNPNYQPYQGKDQQNQGTYQSEQYSPKGAGASGYPNVQQAGAGNPSLGTQPSYGSQSTKGYNTGGSGTPGQWNTQSQGGGYQLQSQGQSASGGQGYKTPGGQGYNVPSGQGYSAPGSQGHSVPGSQGQWKNPSQGVGYQTQYQGQPSHNVNSYAQRPAGPSYGGQNINPSGQQPREQEDDGEYHEKDEEQQGPPKGFFYKFDYPVGIIVSKGGPAQGSGYHPQERKPDAY